MPWFWQAVFLLIFCVPLIILFAYSAWDIVRRHDLKVVYKALWFVVLIVFPIVGPLVYLVIRSPGSAEHELAVAEDQVAAHQAGPAAQAGPGSVREQRGGQVL
jgi:hypothetical protein